MQRRFRFRRWLSEHLPNQRGVDVNSWTPDPRSRPTYSRGGIVTRQFTIFASVMCLGILLTESSPSLAAPDVVPKLNTRTSCESPGRKAIAHGSLNLSIEACLRSENEAHEVLIKHWSQYAKSDKMNCHGMVTKGGPPSYVELHSCLESRKHSREIRETHHNNLKEEFRPKRRGQE